MVMVSQSWPGSVDIDFVRLGARMKSCREAAKSANMFVGSGRREACDRVGAVLTEGVRREAVGRIAAVEGEGVIWRQKSTNPHQRRNMSMSAGSCDDRRRGTATRIVASEVEAASDGAGGRWRSIGKGGL